MAVRPDLVRQRVDLLLSAKHNGLMTTHDMARRLGSRGGRARATRLSADERRRIAALGGQARQRSFETTRRVVANLQYAMAVRELRGAPAVVRVKTFKGPLPKIDTGR